MFQLYACRVALGSEAHVRLHAAARGDALKGKLTSDLEIFEKIGIGSIGAVCRGRDLAMGSEVAIKVIRPEFASRPQVVERFLREADALQRLSHPNIAQLYRFVEERGHLLLVMEYVQGRTLSSILRASGPFGLESAAPLFVQALRALDYAHSQGIVHLDIKGSNLMLDREGTLKLLDFGLARCIDDAKPDSGSIVGTPQYMSPEQLRGDAIDARSDLYSLAVFFYEMLAGRRPFEQEHDADLVRAQIEEPPPPLRDVAPEVPEELEQVILRALSKSPDERFASASEFQQALEACLPAEICEARVSGLADLAARPGSAFDLDGGDPPTRELDLGWDGKRAVREKRKRRKLPGSKGRARSWATAAVLSGLLVFTLDFEGTAPGPEAPDEPPVKSLAKKPVKPPPVPTQKREEAEKAKPATKAKKQTIRPKLRRKTVRKQQAPKPKTRAADTSRAKTAKPTPEENGWDIQR